MDGDKVIVSYLVETALPLEKAAGVLAGETSAGTFVRVHGESDELRRRCSAQIESIQELGAVFSPSLPGARAATPAHGPASWRRARVTLSIPMENLEPSLPMLTSVIAGNAFELGPFSGLRIVDLDLPPAFGRSYPGPQFGVSGTRALAAVHGRPLIGTIIKPSVGLSPEQTAEVVRILVSAGVDFIKDDEKMGNPPHSPFEQRVEAVMRVIREYEQKAGRKVMYGFSITGDLDDMLRRHDVVVKAGGSCVMVNFIQAGLGAVAWLRRRAAVPIHGHRDGWGALSRHPLLGWDFAPFQKIWRLAGVDHLHVNGLRNKFCEGDDSVTAAARSCLEPLFGGMQAMPVFGSGQWAAQAPETYAALKSVDLMYLAGGGILGHPDGPAAGVASLREAWEAAVSGIPLATFAGNHPALRKALEKYGAA